MKIVSVHGFYTLYGGEDVCFEEEKKLLESHGNEVHTYTVKNTDMDRMSKREMIGKIFWNRESYNNVRELIQRVKPDILHVTNTFPLLSLSVYDAGYDENIPVVQSFHNYRISCPNAQFLRKGRVCEDCSGKLFAWPSIVHACWRESRLYTGAVASVSAFHKLRRTSSKKANAFIALTEFARKKLIEGGLPPARIHVKQNFLDPDPGEGDGGGGYAVFIGRISKEKGIQNLLDAWKKLPDTRRIKIVGDGPLADLVKKAESEIKGVEYLGKKDRVELLDIVGKAEFLVIPSIWYEVLPLVIIESLAKGTPVLVADIGSISELITPYQDGIRFNPGDVDDLASACEEMFNLASKSNDLRKGARKTYLDRYTAETNYKILMDIYHSAINYKHK